MLSMCIYDYDNLSHNIMFPFLFCINVHYTCKLTKESCCPVPSRSTQNLKQVTGSYRKLKIKRSEGVSGQHMSVCKDKSTFNNVYYILLII